MKLTNEQEHQILINYKGQSLAKLSKEIGYDTRTIKRVLDKAGIKRSFTTTNSQVKAQIVKEYVEGKSSIELASKYNIHLQSVLNYVKELGYNIRSNEINSRKLKYNERYFKNIDTEDKAYWLGFIVADGCVVETIKERAKNPSYSLIIQLSIKDKDHLEKFKQSINYNGEIKITNVFTQGAYRDYATIRICNKKLCDDLAKWGVVPNKTFNTIFPYNIPPNLYRHFIRGYWDGDGHLCTSVSQVGCIGSKKFINSLQCVCRRFNKDLTKVKLYPNKSMYDYKKGGTNQAKLLANFIYKDATIYLDRKYKLYQDLYS
jgi:hypothetical protein